MENEKKSKRKKKIIIIVIVSLLLIIGGVLAYFLMFKQPKLNDQTTEVVVKSDYWMKDNSLQDFDIEFLKIENQLKNKVYSPLSIKYALKMLEEGADNSSKQQINSVLGDYKFAKYENSKNLSLANALFVKDSYKENINSSYVSDLKDNYNASVLYDSFKTPNYLNKWVSDNTFKLIDNLFDDVSENDFILANALAIDMEWVNKIQSKESFYTVEFAHEDYRFNISPFSNVAYTELEFGDNKQMVNSVLVGAVANKYDIIDEIGEDEIRQTVKDAYSKWLKDPDRETCGVECEVDVETYVDKYIKDISKNYSHISGSTDFEFYVDDEVKTFAKDLKTYDGTTLQYVGIMPKTDTLDNCINNMNAEKINGILSNLKPIKLESFKDGVVTEISANIPMFKFEYNLDLVTDLKKMGISDVFDSNKSDLSKLTSQKGALINDAKHKANIEFSNDGIKAAAATSVVGFGGGAYGFDYLYDIPVEKIDLTFDNPYLFMIRDKESGEVWFTGTVYEPVKFEKEKDVMW